MPPFQCRLGSQHSEVVVELSEGVGLGEGVVGLGEGLVGLGARRGLVGLDKSASVGVGAGVLGFRDCVCMREGVWWSGSD